MSSRFTHFTTHLFLASWTCLALVGCGGGIEVAPVRGTVFLDSKPLADATVIFYPSDGRPSMGITNELGEYELSYIREVKGAVIGQHKVSISTYLESDPDSSDPVIQKGRPEIVPDRYNTKSTLTAEVLPGEEVMADFLLDSEPATVAKSK